MALKRFCTRLQLFLGLLLLAAAPARAQFLGFTSPQTITQAAFTAQSCAAVGGGVFFTVRNIGQSVHYVLYQTSGPIQAMGIEIRGSRDGSAGSFFRISETANAVTAGGIFASIYLPVVQIAITSCTGTGLISATYTGTSVATSSPVGIFTSSGTYNKDVAIGLPANTTATFTVPLPNGGTGGAVYFKYSAATCAASTMTVTAGPDATHQITLLNAVALANVATTQAFTVPAIPATIAVVTYTTGCPLSAATYDLSFSVGERIVTANVTANFTGGATVLPESPGFSCTHELAISFVAAGAGTTEIVPAVLNSTSLICHISLSVSAAVNVRIDNGTGANCAVGTGNLSGPYQNISTLALDFGWWGAIRVPQSNAICLNVSGATTVGGVIVYAQF